MTEINNCINDLFYHSYYGMIIFDQDLNVVTCNDSFKNFFFCDLHKDDLFKLSECFYSEFYEVFISEFEKLKNSPDNNLSFDYLYKYAENKEKWLGVKLHRGPEYDGKTFCNSYFEDITDFKISQNKLEESKKLAEQATRTKSDFLANMSHEIRTPLHTIIGMTELLLETALDVEQEEYGDQIFFSAEVLLNLINDILDFSKIEAGKLVIEDIPFDLYETLEAAVSLISMEAHKKDLEIILSIAPDVPEIITGDQLRLRQIIINLLNNAIKFTAKGEISISCSVTKRVAGKTVLLFAIRDTGIGIPENRKNKLFNSFTQVDSSVTRKYGGSGLGLSICKNLVQLFKGKIGLDSIEGKGSVFWFAFPTIELEKSSKRYFPSEKLPEKFKVLIVDDNTTSRRQLRKYAEELGAFVYESVSGRAALDFMNKTTSEGPDKIDLIMIDKKMPGMDGWQLAAELNADPVQKKIKKILMTPVGKSGDEAKMKLLNWFDVYLNKPVKKWELFTAFYKALDIVIDIEPEKGNNAEAEQAIIKELLLANKKLVLLAEDYYVNQKLFKTILNNLNIDVDVASNGLEAAEAAADKNYDLIFMDIQMPVMNGYQSAVKIREQGSKTPIIAVTANAVAGEKKKCTDAGMDDFLTKPFKKGDLFPLINKWLLSDCEVAELEELDSEDSGNLSVNDSDAEELSIEDLLEDKDITDVFEHDESVFNYQDALETFMDEKDILNEVLSEFAERVDSQLSLMVQLLADEKYEDLMREAHSIKGGSWNLSMKRLGDASELLETSAREKKDEKSAVYIKDVAAEFKNVKYMLNRIDHEQSV